MVTSPISLKHNLYNYFNIGDEDFSKFKSIILRLMFFIAICVA